MKLTNAFGRIVGVMLLCFALVSCGDSKKDSGDDAPRNEGNNSSGDNTGDNTGDTDNEGSEETAQGTLADGKYYMSAGSFEAFDSSGNKIDAQTLQITGDYFWILAHQGEESYELTASGSAKISSNNEILAEVNCQGAQDVYLFELTSSGALRNFKTVAAGCPQASQIESALQMTIEGLNANSFSYTVVNQSEGTRVIETYVFRK